MSNWNQVRSVDSVLRDIGVSHPVLDGKLHRCGKKQELWYRANTCSLKDGRSGIFCSFGNWVSGEKSKIYEISGSSPRAKYRPHAAPIVASPSGSSSGEREFAAAHSKSLIQKLPASGYSHYLERKKVSTVPDSGLRFSKTFIFVPSVDIDGNVFGGQRIYGDGRKYFIKGQAKKGLFHLIGEIGSKLYICEGLATGLSIRMASTEAVAVAFDAGNLESVALAFRKRYPSLHIVIAADNDRQRESEGKGNPGLDKARQAACSSLSRYVYPTFEGEIGTDFNDLYIQKGIDIVAEQLLDEKFAMSEAEVWNSAISTCQHVIEELRLSISPGVHSLPIVNPTCETLKILQEKLSDLKHELPSPVRAGV
jgi:putative DNA primase/helicase